MPPLVPHSEQIPSETPGDSEAVSDIPRVAVVGSGLAGLSAAYLLSVNGYTVDLYEKSGRLGMAAANVTVPGVEGEEEVVMDVPMRSFFPEHYSHLTALYKYLKIPYHASENSMSFSTYVPIAKSYAEQSAASLDTTPYFSFSCYKIPFTSFSISYPDLPSPFAFISALFQAITSTIYGLRVMFGYVKFLVVVKYLAARGQLAPQGPLKNVTLGQFWDLYGIGMEFVEGAFEPLFCGVCTCSTEVLRGFPAVFILEYAVRAMPFGKMSFVSIGVQSVCEALSKPVRRVFLNTSVESVHSGSDTVDNLSDLLDSPHLVVQTASGIRRLYNHVIFATQANQAAKILQASKDFKKDRPAQRQVEVLEKFLYAKSLVVCHTDEALMPADKGVWRCLNFFTTKEQSLSRSEIGGSKTLGTSAESVLPYDAYATSSCSHWFNRSHPSLTHPKAPNYYQTTNPHALPSPSLTLSNTSFERAVVTMSSWAALESLDGIQGAGGRWFVGSYAWEGIPLLEGCVASSVNVVNRISKRDGNTKEIRVPWSSFVGSDNSGDMDIPWVVVVFGLAIAAATAMVTLS
ncbi:hypothetical protein SpCBS45565_g02440 [Spizellomyces sp. 'palustris']|nr:hypothetical protein SpCBS45565_g02440 [Spizellomyces sp. 'palustris']